MLEVLGSQGAASEFRAAVVKVNDKYWFRDPSIGCSESGVHFSNARAVTRKPLGE